MNKYIITLSLIMAAHMQANGQALKLQQVITRAAQSMKAKPINARAVSKIKEFNNRPVEKWVEEGMKQKPIQNGVGGAIVGAFLGKAAVSVIGHGSILLVSSAVGIFCPPAGWALGISLKSTCGPMIEAASIKGAIAGGIAGGVATGPV